MEEFKFKVGDVVRLKSGSPEMTIVSWNYNWSGWDCGYFVRDEDYKSITVQEDALVKVN